MDLEIHTNVMSAMNMEIVPYVMVQAKLRGTGDGCFMMKI